MENGTVRQLSLLGILLIFASAVTAAIKLYKVAPEQINSDNNGRVLLNSGVGGIQMPPIYSCVNVFGLPDCHVTEYSGTGIETYILTSNGNIYQTIENTSLSYPYYPGDTTSILQMIN